MQTTTIQNLGILLFFSVFFVRVNSSFNDVTSKVALKTVDGILAAFGDFNGDKATDLFIISKLGKKLDVWTWDQGTLKFSYFKSLLFTDRFIVNVAPGDFNGDGCLDVAITTQTSPLNSPNDQPKKVYISWGNKNKLTNIKDSFVLEEDLKDQPSIVDVNGDLLPDLFGTIHNANNASLERRTYWISEGKNKTFTSQYQSSNITTKDGKLKDLDPVRIPSSNAFLDLTGDMTADFFITSKNKFEIWKNEDGILQNLTPDVSLPDGVEHVGQSAFADFDGDGRLDHILPVCQSKSCDKSAVFIYNKGKWSEIMVNHPKKWQFIPPDSDSSVLNVTLMTIRIGDYNMDGYPDGLVIVNVFTTRGILKQIPVLLENKPCNGADSCVNGRTFEMQWKSMTSLTGAVVVAFFDLFENGITDFMVVSESKGKFYLHAIQNNLYVDASFLKVLVLGGATLTSCSGGSLPYGVNQAGPLVMYSITDKEGKHKTGAAAQLSQSSYFALQAPYTVFGLGQTPNFVDELVIGMPRAKDSPQRTHTWPQIIPNSQLIILPYPRDKPTSWKSKLLVTPSKLVLLTALCLLGICVLLAIVIVALHLIEKRADQKEKREDAHKFHFDAM